MNKFQVLSYPGCQPAKGLLAVVRIAFQSVAIGACDGLKKEVNRGNESGPSNPSRREYGVHKTAPREPRDLAKTSRVTALVGKGQLKEGRGGLHSNGRRARKEEMT